MSQGRGPRRLPDPRCGVDAGPPGVRDSSRHASRTSPSPDLREAVFGLSAVVLALAAVGALAVTGIALAAAGSSVNFSFQPSNPHGTLTSGRLAFGTHTNYSGYSPTTRIQLRFDDDIQFNPNSFPKCDPADLSGNITMQQALQACGPAAGAANNAWLWPPNAPSATGPRSSSRRPRPPPPACWCSTAWVPRPRSCCSSG